MKHLLLLFACLLPLTAQASKLSDCDSASYEVIVNNAGAARTVKMSPTSGVIEEWGPVVSFQIKGHPPVTIHNPYEEYCIWNGKITLQRIMNPTGSSGCSFR